MSLVVLRRLVHEKSASRRAMETGTGEQIVGAQVHRMTVSSLGKWQLQRASSTERDKNQQVS